MGERSCLLYNIEKLLQQRGFDVQIRSIVDLRSAFKGLPGPYRSNENLLALLREIRGASDKDVSLWMIAPIKQLGKARRKSVQIRCRLLRSEILARWAAGVKAIDIAHEADVRVSRIYQILKEGEKDGHMAPRPHDRL